MSISSRAQTHDVPMTAPYASGQGNGPASFDGQNPVAYIWVKAPVATGMTVKEVPTTEINPVPT